MSRLGAYTKAIVAFLTVAVLAIVAATEGVNLDDGIDGAEWVAIVVAAFNFIGVYAARNRPYPDPANP